MFELKDFKNSLGADGVLKDWVDHVINTVCHDVYHGYMTKYSAEIILHIFSVDFYQLMISKYGKNWEDTANLNYAIDRYGED